jgi:hypothetical protein
VFSRRRPVNLCITLPDAGRGKTDITIRLNYSVGVHPIVF